CAVHVALSVRGAGFGPPTTFTDACAEPGWQVNPPLVAVSPSGAMIAAWEEISDAGVSRTRVAQRQPDGAWLPTRLLDSGGFPVALPAAITVGQRGDALVAMYRQSARGRAYRARFVALTATGGVRAPVDAAAHTLLNAVVTSPSGLAVIAVTRFATRAGVVQPDSIDVFEGWVGGVVRQATRFPI